MIVFFPFPASYSAFRFLCGELASNIHVHIEENLTPFSNPSDSKN